ncbi:MAG: 23S rRNA (adenine(2503)-C(2))-methyltransferase RlmN, partial [Candidatus Cloacimonadaceae bacterium]|nr:23S rRNA (adenine(2503)-C(2))-methyltransferase RlmN [Candidatus Cloacimonadaceae bacterium]
NLVLMGMGEPLDNLQNVLDAIKLIQHIQSLAFSPRRTTISTCGIVPGIIKLADSGIRTKLAVSLNSAIDAVRDQIMPINLKYPLAQLKNALLYYQQKSPFRITIEYILIPGVNMSSTDIKALRRFAGDLSCKINFIPYNPVPNLPFEAPGKAQIETFMTAAMSIPQAVTLRKSKGADIMGACGQLALAKTSLTGEIHE